MCEIYFISGPGDLSEEEFEVYYVPILLSLNKDSQFIIGDYQGADRIAKNYLSKNKYVHVTIYHMYGKPRYGSSGYPTKGGFESDEERDYALTHDSTQDICFIIPGRESGGTSLNLIRRFMMNETILGNTFWDIYLERIHKKKSSRKRHRRMK